MTRNSSIKSLFDELARQPSSKPKSRKRPAPVSLRLNEAELAALRDAASGRSINGYIRERLFGDAAPIAATNPVAKDHEALARVLGQLGRSDLFNSLSRIVLAQEEGRIALDDDLGRELRTALRNVTLMRADLLVALGLRKN